LKGGTFFITKEGSIAKKETDVSVYNTNIQNTFSIEDGGTVYVENNDASLFFEDSTSISNTTS
jgi:hypothetical protein